MSKKFLIKITFIIVLFLICLLLGFIVFNPYFLKKNFENGILPFADKNQNTIFTINKVVFFSSCDAKNKASSATNFTIENLYQYTDIALFINSPNSNKDLENTLKKVSINNIKYTTLPIIGEQKLYFKSINQFANSNLVDENIIEDSLDFSVTSEDLSDLSIPILYNNLANPITLSYTNQNLKTDYTITDTSSPITYDGSLLKTCGILLNSLSCKLSFDIIITNNLNQEFKSTVFLDIPLENEEKSIYDGNVVKNENVNFTFYRYK